MILLYYIHGFLSSPRAAKAKQLSNYLVKNGLMGEFGFGTPALPDTPKEAWAHAVQFFERELEFYGDADDDEEENKIVLVGSSMGGFFATLLAEKFKVPAVLLNPCIHPQDYFLSLCGPQVNTNTGKEFVLTPDMAPFLEELDKTAVANPDRLKIYLGDADEVLDYKKSLDFYKGCDIKIIPGADHTFSSTFESFIPEIIDFARKA